MLNRRIARDFFSTPNTMLFGIYGAVLLASLFLALATGWRLLAAAPLALLIVYLTIVDLRAVFLLLLAFIPLSTEFTFSEGLGTDLPTEPLMVGLLLAYGVYLLRHGREQRSDFLRHSLSLLVLLHLFWIYITTLTSDLPWVSIKFALAKTWYIVVFFYLAGSQLKRERDLRVFFWVIFIPLMFTVLITLARHARYNFSFEEVYRVFWPFYRNHVNYAALLSLFFPLVWLATGWYRRQSKNWWLLVGSLALLAVAIYFSYTRAAYVSLGIALGAYWMFRLRLVRYVIPLALAFTLGGVAYLVNDNHYLEYAPDYHRTISHDEFDNLLQATYQGEDISTMERVYRWVAGFRMSAEKPVFGFGPGNFVNFYKRYTVNNFRTYVSDNEGRSGIHSYYLMTGVEQGITGLLIFLLLSFFALILGERVYHQSSSSGRRRLVMMALLSTVVIDAFLIINDMIETDKVGPFFFINLAILINADLANRRDRLAAREKS